MGKKHRILAAMAAVALGLYAANASAEDVICIDPGHGGTDPGATGCDLQEAAITLDVGLRLKPLLEAAGYSVVMTRDTDVFVELADRTAFANAKGAKAFASVHVNSAGAVATGLETYCYGPKDDKNKVGCTYKKGANYSQAYEIQNAMLEAWPTPYTAADKKTWNRGVKQANYYVLHYTNMPATLTEIGFINNCDKDAVYLGDETHRQEAAEAHCRALVAKWGGDASKCTSAATPAKTGRVCAGTYEGSIAAANWLSGVTYEVIHDLADPWRDAQTVTSADKVFCLDVPVGNYVATASKDGYNTVTRDDCEPATEGKTVYCSIALTKEGAVVAKGTATGIVTGADTNAPVAATVDTQGVDSVQYDGSTDWSLELDPGTHWITASADGYEDGSVSCTVVSNQSTYCPITLTPQKGSVTGDVHDASGAKVAATVSLGAQKAEYDGNGTWSFDVDAGTYTVTAQADGYDMGSASCVVPRGETVTCNIEIAKSTGGKGMLRGRLLDASSSAVIAGEVSIAGGAVYHYDGHDKWQFYLAPGSHTVTGKAAGYDDGTATCTVEAGKATDCDIRLTASLATVSGVVFSSVDRSVHMPATVTVGDKSVEYAGTGSWTLQIAPGTYEFTATDGSWSGKTSCKVEAGRTNTCNIALVNPAAAKGKLTGIIHDADYKKVLVAGDVRIDGYSGTSYSGTGTWEVELPVGTHVVRASANGYYDNAVSCVVYGGDEPGYCAVPLKSKNEAAETPTAPEETEPGGNGGENVEPTPAPAPAPAPESKKSSDGCSAAPLSGHGSVPAALLALFALIGLRRRSHKGASR